MTATRRGTLTIDHGRGVYVQHDARGTREHPYRSQHSAALVADFLRWRGYTVEIIEPNNTNQKGITEMNEAKKLQKTANQLRAMQQRGTVAISGERRRAFIDAGLVEKQGRRLMPSAAGLALMAQYPPQEDAPEETVKKVKSPRILRGNPNGLGINIPSEIVGVPAIDQEQVDQSAETDAIVTEMRAILSQISAAAQHLTEAEKQRLLALYEARRRMLSVVRDVLPDEYRPLADAIARINDLTE